MSGRPDSDASDVAQEAIAAVVANYFGLDMPYEELERRAIVIARRRVADYYRRRCPFLPSPFRDQQDRATEVDEVPSREVLVDALMEAAANDRDAVRFVKEYLAISQQRQQPPAVEEVGRLVWPSMKRPDRKACRLWAHLAREARRLLKDKGYS